MTLAVCLIICSFVVLINFFVDPLQFFRKASYRPVFDNEDRYQAPGLARNYDYNAVIIGSSLAANFLPSDAGRKLNAKVIKLTMDGSTVREQYLLAKVALRTGKVKTVIWSLDTSFSIFGGTDEVRDDYGPFPYYLYDENKANDINYLFSSTVFKKSVRVLLGLCGIMKNESTPLEYLSNWQKNSKDVFGRESVGKDYVTAFPRKMDSLITSNGRKNLDKYIIPLIKEYPGTTFMIFYPPFSLPFYKKLRQKHKHIFEAMLDAQKYFADQTSDLPNVKIYDFQSVDKITTNLDYYKDCRHYSQDINSYMIEEMAADRHRVTKDNVDSMLLLLRKQIDEYKYSPNMP